MKNVEQKSNFKIFLNFFFFAPHQKNTIQDLGIFLGLMDSSLNRFPINGIPDLPLVVKVVKFIWKIRNRLALLALGLRALIGTGSRSTAFKELSASLFFLHNSTNKNRHGKNWRGKNHRGKDLTGKRNLAPSTQMAPKCPAFTGHGAQLSGTQSAAPKRRHPNEPPPKFYAHHFL